MYFDNSVKSKCQTGLELHCNKTDGNLFGYFKVKYLYGCNQETKDEYNWLHAV
jgi:hypothetical protein